MTKQLIPRMMPSGRRAGACCTLLFGLLMASNAWSQGDLASLCDEFDAPSTLSAWSRLHVTEQWNAEGLATWDIATTSPSRMTMIPETVVWYADWVGPLAYKLVQGDFALSTWVRATARDGVTRPAADFSLAGLMFRAPVARTPATWTPGQENYVFLSLGFGTGSPAGWQHEVKTTVNSQSTLVLSDAPGPEAGLQLVRLGDYVITLRRAPNGAWRVHRRYARPDLPAVLQAGFVSYTDWNKCQHFDPWIHNQTVLHPPLPPTVVDPRPDVPFAPDLRASFEHARFHRVVLPPSLSGIDLTNEAAVPDTVLLAFLGGHVDDAAPVLAVEAASPPRTRVFATPNPARGALELEFTWTAPVPVDVDVFDLSGARVRRLPRLFDGGVHRLRWDGTADDGRAVQPGVYLVRINGGAVQARTRVVWLGR